MPDTLTIRIPPRLRSDLRRISKDEHLPMSDLVRESLRRYVAVRRFRRMRARAVPYAQARGLYTDEDIFNVLG